MKYISFYICISHLSCTMLTKYLTYKSMAFGDLLSGNLGFGFFIENNM